MSRGLYLQVIASRYSGVLSPKFIFSCITIATIFAYLKCIVSYCCSRENETLESCLLRESWLYSKTFSIQIYFKSNREEKIEAGNSWTDKKNLAKCLSHIFCVKLKKCEIDEVVNIFTIFTLPIRHPVYPQKFCINYVNCLQFLLWWLLTPRKN